MIGPSISSCEHTLNTLRYADRVKELAVGSTEDVGGDTEEECDNNCNQSGLAELRNLNVGECSQDWFGFQESVARLQALEEELVETHRNVLEDIKVWSKQDSTLLQLTNQVDYDQDAYAMILEEMLDEKLVALDQLAAKAREFRSCLAAEEAASNKRRK